MMEPREAAAIVKKARDLLDNIPDDIYQPFDDLVADAINSLDDVMTVIRPLIE